MSVKSHETAVMATPKEAIDQVMEELALDEQGEDELRLNCDRLMYLLGVLCEGYRCKYEDLPAPFAMMAETAHRRGRGFGFERSKFIDLLWKYRRIETA